MKSKIIVAALMLALVAGCSWTSAERYEFIEGLVKDYQQQSSAMSQVIADVKVELAKYPDSEKFQKLLDETEARKAEIDVLATQYEARLTAIDKESPGADWQAVGAGMTTAAPMIPPPWGAIVGIAGTIIAGVGTASSRKSATKAEKLEKKYQAHKNGVEAIKIGMDVDAQKNLFNAIGEARKALGVV
ncbi:MAG: hypothetical protein GY869_14720 [Planctomycetes bacterium]|nr:hypothetical protein [Planctomycetota bacterium]